MENAAKALLIAGEVLIGVIILSILSMVFRKALTVSEAYQERTERQAVIRFNVEFQQYITNENKKLQAEDVISLINRVYDWNKNEGHNVIELIVKLPADAKITVGREIKTSKMDFAFNEKNFLTTYKLVGNTNITPQEEYKFDCKMTYGGENGRIDNIEVICIEN